MEPYILLSQIRPGDRNWTAKVLVEDKLNLSVNSRGTKVLKLLVSDEKWTMRAHNYVKHIEDASLQIPYPPITSALLSDFQSYTEKALPLDMVAIVVEVREPKPQESHMIQEFVIINQELKPIQFTLWNDFLKNKGVTLAAMKDKMPIIMCKRLKAGTFWGMPCLSTTPSSFIAIEPSIPEVVDLQTWKNKNLETIRLALHEYYYNHFPSRITRLMPDKIISVMQLASGSNPVLVKGHITIPNIDQPFSYLSCSSCGAKTAALPQHEFTCNICGKHGLPSPRCWLLVDFIDQIGSINAAVFDKYAEKILGITAAEIAASKTEELRILSTSAADRFAEKEIVAEIRASRKTFSDGIVRFNIKRWFEADGATIAPPNISATVKTSAIVKTSAKSLLSYLSASSSNTTFSASHKSDSHNKYPSTSETATSSYSASVSAMNKLKLEGN